MFSKKSFIKLFSVGMLLLQCKTSIVVKKPELSNFLEIRAENHQWDLLKNLPNTPPAQANAISISSSKGVAKAINNSVAQVVNAVKSNQVAEANAKDGSIALAVSSGNTDLKTQALADNNSNAVGVGVAATGGKATADAELGSVAVAATKNDNVIENKLLATNDSNVVTVSSSVSGADAASVASQGSLADSKAIDTVKTSSDVKADDKSTSVANTSNESLSTTNANALNSSKAQSVSESTSNAKTDLTAVEASRALGNLEVKSGADSVANAVNGGNAISTSESKTNGDNTGSAEKGSNIILNNKSENQATAASISEGTLQGDATIPERNAPESPAILPSAVGETRRLQRGGERRNVPVLKEGRDQPEDFCAETNREDESKNFRGQRDNDLKREEAEESFCNEEEKSGTALTQSRTNGDESEIESGCEKSEAEFKCREDPRRSQRLRAPRRNERKINRKEERLNKRRALRNEKLRSLRQDRRKVDKKIKNEEDCESDFTRPTFKGTTVAKTVPKVDLAANANMFIINNANGIKMQSADNLARIQNLLNKKNC
jgi:hypothetical protein